MFNNIKVTDNDSVENESELLDNIKISYAPQGKPNQISDKKFS